MENCEGFMNNSFRILNIFLVTLTILFFGCSTKVSYEFEKIEVSGTKNPVINLDGTWKFTMNPPAEFWNNNVDPTHWGNIQVPGECAMQGFAIQHDSPYAYKTKFRKIIKAK